MATLTLRPDDPRISYSDYLRLTLSAERARFDRLIDADHGMAHDNPAARVRFRTDGAVTAGLHYTAMHTHEKANGIGVVLIDGKQSARYGPSARPGPIRLVLAPEAGAMRTYEILLPYADSVDFTGLEVSAGAGIETVAQRPRFRYVAYGDSITQGYWASDVTRNFVSLLAVAKDWTPINMGFGGRQATAGDGEIVGAVSADLITVCMGANDAAANKPAGRFRADMEAIVTGIRAKQPLTPLHIITPLYSTQPYGGPALEEYRREIRALVAGARDGNLHVIEGPALTGHDEAHLPDGVHPNDRGFAVTAQRLAELLP